MWLRAIEHEKGIEDEKIQGDGETLVVEVDVEETTDGCN